MADLRLRHVTIDGNPPGGRHDITLLHDLTGNGLPDIIIGGKDGPSNLFWYENPGWQRLRYAEDFVTTRVVVADIDENGRLEIVPCEGESDEGRLAVCRPPEFRPWVIRSELFHPTVWPWRTSQATACRTSSPPR